MAEQVRIRALAADQLASRRGRPKGQINAPDHKAGQPSQQTESRAACYAHWRAWWATRPNCQLSANALAARLKQPASTVLTAANGSHPPNQNLLFNLKTLSSTYGYEPLPIDHQTL